MKYCPKCGKEIEDESTFCMRCGQRQATKITAQDRCTKCRKGGAPRLTPLKIGIVTLPYVIDSHT